MTAGTVVINEVSRPIIDIMLAEGKVTFVTEFTGPCDLGDGTWLIFGRDGSLIFKGYSAILDGTEILTGTTFVLSLSCEIPDKIGSKALAHEALLLLELEQSRLI